jgi:hypothetical protein
VSKHIIFFVAGVGDEVKNWSIRLRKSFQELFDSYPLPPGGLPFDEMFETEEIFHNDFFDEWRKPSDHVAPLGEQLPYVT